MSQLISLDKCIERADHTGILLLVGRNLRQFPMSAQDLSDLQDTLEADISKNRFDKIPREICMFSGLEKLKCYHNSIRTVPEYITYMSNLRHLDLSRNYIPSLPPEMCRLNLVSLDLSCNRLVALPVDIGQMVTLQHLDLSCNSLPDLPKGFTNLKNLRHLNLHQNELKELPKDIDRMPLVHLDASTNLIRRLPTSLRNILSLVVLEVNDNPMECPPSHVCVRGRVHIFKYLSLLDEQGVEPQALHATPVDLRRRRGDKRRSRPPSGYSTMSVESSGSSFADEMHRFVDSAFGNIASASQPDLHHQEFNSHYPPSQSLKGSSVKGSSSPGKKRMPAANQSATLPRSTNASKTIEEEPEQVSKQHSVPARTNDNRGKMNHGGGVRSLPRDTIPRSGSWNAHQRRVVEGQEEEDRSAVPVHSQSEASRTPEMERRAAPAFTMRNAKSTSDMITVQQTPSQPQHPKGGDHSPPSQEAEPGRCPTPETPKRDVKAGLALPIKLGHEAGSGDGDEQLTPTADEQPMVLWESEGPGLAANGLGGMDNGEGKVANSTVELDQVTISLKPEKSRDMSPHPGVSAHQKVVDDDTLTRRKGKGEESVEPAKETQEAIAETVKEVAIGETAKPKAVAEKAQVVNAEPEKTVRSPTPSDTKGKVSEAKSTPAKKVSPTSSKVSSAEVKKPTPRTAGSASGRPIRPKSMADAKELSPVRPAIPVKPTLRAGQLRKSASPSSSKESSPVHQPARQTEVSPSRSTDAAPKKDAGAGRGVTAKPKAAGTPGKLPARQPVASGSPRGRAVAKTGATEAKADGSPSRGVAGKPKSTGSPSRGAAAKPKSATGSPSQSPSLKRKADVSSVKATASKQEGLPAEKPLARVRSDETNSSSPASRPKTKGGTDKEDSGPDAQSPEKKTDKGDGEVAKKQSEPTSKAAADVLQRRKRRISSGSSGSEEGRRSRTASHSSMDDGEELKEAMKKRSLPRQQVDFTVKRQEMNMMHGYKKMLVVKQSLEQLLGKPIGEDLLGSLEDGIVLCQIMDKLHPGTIVQFHTPADDQPLSIPKKIRNVEAFIKGCKALKLEHVCTAGDIMDCKDPMKVLKCVDDLLSSA